MKTLEYTIKPGIVSEEALSFIVVCIMAILYVGSLSISQLEYSTGNGLLTLTCKTRNSPPSIIRWYRDNNLLDIDGSDYNMSVSVTNRHNSRFNIQLIVCGTVENMVGTYKCEAGNRHGMDYEFRHISGIDGKVTMSQCYILNHFLLRFASPV